MCEESPHARLWEGNGAVARELGIGLIGSGFMGRAHALAFRAAAGTYALPAQPRLEILADADEEAASRAASALGFRRSTADWRALVTDPAVDIVAITTPNALHKPMSLAALAAGKHVYCEKPLATSAAEADEMARAAEASGRVTMVGFNYLRNPVIALAKQIVDSGDLGAITGLRGIFAEGFMADPNHPWTWRCDPAQAGGALGDLGSHLISMARHLLGPIEAVSGQLDTVHTARPDPAQGGAMRAVEVDDQANVLARFGRGCTGSLSASWIAAGQTMQLAFELTGTKGALAFTQERLNELRYYKPGQRRGQDGFTLIVAGPDHPDYARFCPAPGHQLGFNDLKTIEVARLIEAVAGGRPAYPDFREAREVERVAEAVRRSSREQRWVRIAEV